MTTIKKEIFLGDYPAVNKKKEGPINKINTPAASLRLGVVFDEETISLRLKNIERRKRKIILFSVLLSVVIGASLSIIYFIVVKPIMEQATLVAILPFFLTLCMCLAALFSMNLIRFLVEPQFDQLHEDFPSFSYQPWYIFQLAKRIRELGRTVQSVIDNDDYEEIKEKQPELRGQTPDLVVGKVTRFKWEAVACNKFDRDFKDIPTRVLEKIWKRENLTFRSKRRARSNILSSITTAILIASIIIIEKKNMSIKKDDDYINLSDDDDDGRIDPIISLIPLFFNLFIMVVYVSLTFVLVVFDNEKKIINELLDKYRIGEISQEELLNRISSSF